MVLSLPATNVYGHTSTLKIWVEKKKHSTNITPSAATALISRERSSIKCSISGALVASISSWLTRPSRHRAWRPAWHHRQSRVRLSERVRARHAAAQPARPARDQGQPALAAGSGRTGLQAVYRTTAAHRQISRGPSAHLQADRCWYRRPPWRPCRRPLS